MILREMCCNAHLHVVAVVSDDVDLKLVQIVCTYIGYVPTNKLTPNLVTQSHYFSKYTKENRHDSLFPLKAFLRGEEWNYRQNCGWWVKFVSGPCLVFKLCVDPYRNNATRCENFNRKQENVTSTQRCVQMATAIPHLRIFSRNISNASHKNLNKGTHKGTLVPRKGKKPTRKRVLPNISRDMGALR